MAALHSLMKEPNETILGVSQLTVRFLKLSAYLAGSFPEIMGELPMFMTKRPRTLHSFGIWGLATFYFFYTFA